MLARVYIVEYPNLITNQIIHIFNFELTVLSLKTVN